MICFIIQPATHNNTKTKKELKHSGKSHHQNLCKINQHEFNDNGQHIKQHRPLQYKKPNKKASAYHVSTEGHAMDKSVSKETVFFDEHIHVEPSQSGNIHHWEMAIQLFNNDFDEKDLNPKSVEMTKQKVIGFSIAYGDNDGNNRRENFMGSKVTPGNNNDEGYINANVFGSLLFVE